MTRVVRFAAAGFALGWLVAVAGSCGPEKTCGPGSCDGCCDADGVCQPGTLTTACGVSGNACAACAGDQFCAGGLCTGVGSTTGDGGGKADGGGATDGGGTADGGSTTDGGGPGGDGGTGADGGTGDAGVSAFTAWCASYATAYCDAQVTCKRIAAADQARCVQLFEDVNCLQEADGLRKGYASFDAARGQRCLAELAEMKSTCTPYLTSNCYEIARPASGEGQGCFVAANCTSEDLGCGGPPCGRTCQQGGGLNQPCSGGYECDPGLWCERGTGENLCRAPKPVGSSCTGDSQCGNAAYCNGTTRTCTALPTASQACRNYQCAPGYYCDNATICRARVGVGGTCTYSSTCVADAYCSGGVCVADQGIGGSCTSSMQCLAPLLCGAGICQQPMAEGQLCRDDIECANSLTCDDVTRTCTRWLQVDPGQACTGDARYCSYGNSCGGAVQNPDGGVGTAGTCRAAAPGDRCTSGYDCTNGTHCATPDGGYVGFCASASLGSPCSTAANCQPAHFCKDGSCALKANVGQPCTQETGSCVAPYLCKGNNVCGEPGGAGATCYGDSDDCKFFTECAGGSCTPVGLSGQRCPSYGTCYYGQCQGRNPDAGIAGTCGPPAPEGSYCDLPTGCASASCLEYICLECP